MSAHVAFWTGVLGGVIAQFLAWAAYATNPAIPQYYKTLKFWIAAAGYIALGGYVSREYSASIKHGYSYTLGASDRGYRPSHS